MAQEQLQGGLLGEHRDLDRVESPQLTPPRREQDAAGQSQGTRLGAYRAGELGGVVEVIEDQQGLGPSLELREGGLELVVEGLAEGLWPQFGPDPGEAL